MKTGPQGVTQTPGDKVKVKTLDVQKFDSRTHILWIRLVHHTTLGRYRVRWETELKSGAITNTRSERGYLADEVAVDKARAKFADEVRKARLMGWAPCERYASGPGCRGLVMKPLPAAPGSAAGSAA